MTFTIHSETPAKKNSRITLRNGRTIPSKRYTQWHDTASVEILGQKTNTEPIKKPVEIDIQFTHGDFRRRDSDNGTSSILDLLQDCGVLADDNWQIVRKITIKNEYDKNNAKAVITINEIKEDYT